MATNLSTSLMHLSAATPSAQKAPEEIVKIVQMEIEPSSNCTQQHDIKTEIDEEDIKYCNDFLHFEYHIGGYDRHTGIRKPLIGANEQKYVNKNQKQTDDKGMEKLYNGLTLKRFAILAALNDKLRTHSIKLEQDVENANAEIEKLQKKIAKLTKKKMRMSKAKKT